MRRLRDFVDKETLSSIYNALVRPHFDYCSEAWDTLGLELSRRLQKLQNRAARIIMNLRYDTPGIEALSITGWESLETQRATSKAKQMYKVLNYLSPSSLATHFVRKRNITEYDLRGYNYNHPCQKLRILKTASVMKELNGGTRYLLICVIQIHYQHL